MNAVKLVSIETDAKRTYKPTDCISFKLTLDIEEDINDDVEFLALYIGDAYSEDNDQTIGHTVIGPLQKGKQYFQFETTPIDLCKIPIRSLFGLTSILIIGKYHGNQFLRVGYVVDVKYPGVDPEKLQDSDEKAIDGLANEADGEAQSGSDASEEEEEVEVMDDAELEEEDAEEGDAEEGDSEEDDESDLVAEDEDEEDEVQEGDFENLFMNTARGNIKREPVPFETPIKEDNDEFCYKGITMNKTAIELSILENPFISTFEINWGLKADEENKIVESTSNEDENNGNSQDNVDESVKKLRLETE